MLGDDRFHRGNQKQHPQANARHGYAQRQPPFALEPTGQPGGMGAESHHAHSETGHYSVGQAEVIEAFGPAHQNQGPGQDQGAQGKSHPGAGAVHESSGQGAGERLAKDEDGKNAGGDCPAPAEFLDQSQKKHRK